MAEARPGGSFFIEFAPDGTLLGADAEASTVPAALRKAANERDPGGTIIGGEKERVGGRIRWEVVKVMKNGDSLRVGVDKQGKVVRVARRVPGQVRVPR